MRSLAILATIFAASVGTTSALVRANTKTSITTDANGYDTRTSGSGCSPNGCVPANTMDNLEYTRWSCKGDILDSSDEDDGCCITYTFDNPQDIVTLQVAFHKGGSNIRTLDVFNNGNHHGTITSSGSTWAFQDYSINTDETKDLKLCLDDPAWNTEVWQSITNVRFLVL